MTLKYTPISKRIQFAQRGEKFVSPNDPMFITNQTAPGKTTIRNTGYYDDAGYFHSSDGNVYTMEVPEVSELVVTGYNKSLTPFIGEGAVRRAQRANYIDQQKADYYFQSPSPLDIVKGLYYTIRGRRSTNPEDYDGLVTGTADLPFDFNRKGMAKAIFQKAIDSGRDLKQVFSSMPTAAQKEILDDTNLSRQLSTLVGGNQGERVFYASGPSVSNMRSKKGMPFEGEAEYVTPISEQQAKIDDIVELNRKNQARGVTEQELPSVAQPEVSRTTETYWDRIARQVENTPAEQVTKVKKSNASRKPRKTKAQINEEKAAAAREVAAKARQEAFGKASRQYAALSDDEVMSSYREMAKSGKVDTPEYEAILQEGQARKMLDDNGRPISKSDGQKSTSSSIDEPSTATQQNNQQGSGTDKTKWQKINDKGIGITRTIGRLLWEKKDNNFGNVLGSGYKTRNTLRIATPIFVGGKTVGNLLGRSIGGISNNTGGFVGGFVKGYNEGAGTDSTQIQTKTTTPGNQQIVSEGDTTVAGEGPQKPAPKIRKASRASERTDWF